MVKLELGFKDPFVTNLKKQDTKKSIIELYICNLKF